jgi:hypothetical protein
MPKIDLTDDLKKIDLTQFFDEETYIHIKKVDRLTKQKIVYYEFGGTEISMSDNLNQLIKDGKLKENKKLKHYQAVNLLDAEEKERAIENDAKAVDLYLVNGVDPKKHNFYDANEKPIELNLLFWANMAKKMPGMVSYVVSEIREYNNDLMFALKKKKNKK